MTDVAELLGAEREEAEQQLEEVLALETRLANVGIYVLKNSPYFYSA